MTEENTNFEEELRSMKEEMKELKDMLKKNKKTEEDEEVNIGGKAKGFRVSFDNDDFGGFEGVDDTLNDYLGSVMQGVAENIRSSVSQMAKGFSFDFQNVAREMEHAKREMEHAKRDMRREARQAAKEAQRAARHAMKGMQDQRHVIRFHKLSEEELNRFYEVAPNLASALSDEKKLRLLKALEHGPMYQKDLSESTDIKGGTFKHHMDALLEVNYVGQEAVRGRYLITQLGVEALKLSEMLFRRFIFVTEEEAHERESEDDIEVDIDLDEEIDEDISVTAEKVDNLREDDEEEG